VPGTERRIPHHHLFSANEYVALKSAHKVQDLFRLRRNWKPQAAEIKDYK